MTEEEFNQAKELDSKRLAMEQAIKIINRIKVYTKPNINDLKPVIDNLDLLSQESKKNIFNTIEREVRYQKTISEEELQKYLES